MDNEDVSKDNTAVADIFELFTHTLEKFDLFVNFRNKLKTIVRRIRKDPQTFNTGDALRKMDAHRLYGQLFSKGEHLESDSGFTIPMHYDYNAVHLSGKGRIGVRDVRARVYVSTLDKYVNIVGELICKNNESTCVVSDNSTDSVALNLQIFGSDPEKWTDFQSGCIEKFKSDTHINIY
eukprot:GHVR01005549.1.p1 GENE.GHVR01005549.1~~GHVR01005549.1.p1  ORF type:complete len:179 (+),score=40.94 GHVR01005549.1:182-718(+)